MRRFNVTGLCTPEEDYMVDISEKIEQIKQLIDRRCYFTINRARQYGKTTTLNTLRRTLPAEYMCINLSFEGVGPTMFSNAQSFCRRFLWQLDMAAKNGPDETIEWRNDEVTDFDELNVHLAQICAGRKIVLMIDEVDKAGNYEIFLYFLAMLRDMFNARKLGTGAAFHSVILAGVYDIKNIKSKMMSEGMYIPAETEDKKEGSPWNIAADFEVDMLFSPAEIATMLKEYESDHNTGMDIIEISEEIYKYTSGYPFLVSRVCHRIDNKLDKEWTAAGVRNAVKTILNESNTLFDDVFKNLENNKSLSYYIYELLILGKMKSFVRYDSVVSIGVRYGFFINVNGRVIISNKIFELLMTDYFMEKDLRDAKQIVGVLQYDVVRGDRFDMELCLRKFAEYYGELYNKEALEFLERHGRLLFLSYLKPLINGQGFYHIESQFTDLRRMDIAVDFGRQQFIVELKLWKGEKAEMQAYEQLLGYMDTKKSDTGYLVIFDFRSNKNKQRKSEWIDVNGKKIFEVII